MKNLFITILTLGVFSLNSQTSNYSNVKSITALNSSTINALNYQLKLVLNTQSLISAGQMQSNGADIRFYKNCYTPIQYNYWIESGINTPTTVIWVKVDSIMAGNTRNFYFAHGNSTVTAFSSIPLTFNAGGSSTDSVYPATSGGSTNSQRGFRFIPNTDILVTSFGKYEPNGSLRYVTLFNVATTNTIAQMQVGGPAAIYSYSNLPNPIWLQQGNAYSLQLYQGSTDGYYYGGSSQIDPRLTYVQMDYCNGCTQNSFPTNTLSNLHYGQPDMLFYFKNTITPAPTYTLNGSAVSISVANATICEGNSYTINPTGAINYTYSGGSAIVSPTISTTYIISGINTASCVGTNTMQVTVNTKPSLTLSTSSNSTCVGGSQITLTGSPSGGVYTGSFVTGNLFSPSTTGSFVAAYSYTSGLGCSNTTTTTLYAMACVGLNTDHKSSSTSLIYPNPFQNTLTVQSQTEELKQIRVFDIFGKLLDSTQSKLKNTFINLESLPKGIYFLEIIQNGNKQIEKIIKE